MQNKYSIYNINIRVGNKKNFQKGKAGTARHDTDGNAGTAQIFFLSKTFFDGFASHNFFLN